MSGKETLGKPTNDPPCKSVALLALHARTIEGHVTRTASFYEPAGSFLSRTAYNSADCQRHICSRKDNLSRQQCDTNTRCVSYIHRDPDVITVLLAKSFAVSTSDSSISLEDWLVLSSMLVAGILI